MVAAPLFDTDSAGTKVSSRTPVRSCPRTRTSTVPSRTTVGAGGRVYSHADANAPPPRAVRCSIADVDCGRAGGSTEQRTNGARGIPILPVVESIQARGEQPPCKRKPIATPPRHARQRRERKGHGHTQATASPVARPRRSLDRDPPSAWLPCTGDDGTWPRTEFDIRCALSRLVATSVRADQAPAGLGWYESSYEYSTISSVAICERGCAQSGVALLRRPNRANGAKRQHRPCGSRPAFSGPNADPVRRTQLTKPRRFVRLLLLLLLLLPSQGLSSTAKRGRALDAPTNVRPGLVEQRDGKLHQAKRVAQTGQRCQLPPHSRSHL